MKWPHPILPDELARGEYLRPLEPAEELACFLGSRGHCLEDHGRLEEASACYDGAGDLMPCSAYFPRHLQGLRSRHMARRLSLPAGDACSFGPVWAHGGGHGDRK